MSESQIEKIIDHQVSIILKEKGLSVHNLGQYEILTYKYEVAIKLLCTLGCTK